MKTKNGAENQLRKNETNEKRFLLMANYICSQTAGASNCNCGCGCNGNSDNGGSVGGVTDTPTSCNCCHNNSDNDNGFNIPCSDFLIIAAIFLLVLTLFGNS